MTRTIGLGFVRSNNFSNWMQTGLLLGSCSYLEKDVHKMYPLFVPEQENSRHQWVTDSTLCNVMSIKIKTISETSHLKRLNTSETLQIIYRQIHMIWNPYYRQLTKPIRNINTVYNTVLFQSSSANEFVFAVRVADTGGHRILVVLIKAQWNDADEKWEWPTASVRETARKLICLFQGKSEKEKHFICSSHPNNDQLSDLLKAQRR